MARRIREVRVTGLQETFDYRVEFPSTGENVILIAPNGYGKTALLSVLNSCLQFNLVEASRQSFRTLEVIFEDKTKWLFEKTKTEPEVNENALRNQRVYTRRVLRHREWVRVTSFDAMGNPKSDHSPEGLAGIPPDILFRALDRSLPIARESYESFRDITTNDLMSVPEVVEKYKSTLLNDNDFREMLGPYYQMFAQPLDDRINCVFIETQRLLYSTKNDSRDGGPPATHEEEISRQSQHLGALLQSTYSNYASISQGLDRSFPNRLIARAAENPGQINTFDLRADLDAIEARRRALTDAGILVESAEPLIPPKDEFLGKVADALAIYVEDSKAKLDTFDDIYAKVAVFKGLLNKKLRPKELIIGRQSGARVRRGDKDFTLEGLSSGEKHEFIMLFRLIFETPHDSIVLIDEPEISLHVLWQLEFMPDLRSIQAANPFQAIIATHSPQIFQGMDDLIIDLADQAG